MNHTPPHPPERPTETTDDSGEKPMTDETPLPDSLSWAVHPLVERPRQTTALFIIIAVVLLVVRLTFPEPMWVLIAAAFLFASLARFFFATNYQLDNEGIQVRFLGMTRHYRWGTYRRFETGRNGVFLSPFPKPNRLDNFRGLLLLAGRNRFAVEAFVREKIKTNSDDGRSPTKCAPNPHEP